MQITTIWAAHDNKWDQAWLVEAWDEYSIENNHEGWAAALKKAEDSYDEIKVVKLNVSEKTLEKAFEIPCIDAVVEK